MQQQKVLFSTTHQVQFGEIVKVVGQGPQLGKWDVSKAPAMEWSDGDEWTLQVELFPGLTDFKCAVIRPDGSVAAWEPGANRTVEVPRDPCAIIRVNCKWSNTANTLQAISMDEDDTSDNVLDSIDSDDNPQGHGMGFIGAQANGAPQTDTDSPVVPGGDDKELERGGKQGEYGDVDDSDLEKANQDQQDANKKRVEQQGDKKATTSLPGKTEGGGKSGVADNNRQKQDLAPGQGVQLDEVEEGVDLQENPDSSRNPQQGQPGSRQGAQAFIDQSGEDVEYTSVGKTAQFLAGLAGLVAVPVVAWSEYTLQTTGCGLPPGPGGSLGAAEGVAFLTVGALALWSVSTQLRTGQGLPNGPAYVLAAAEKLVFTSMLAGFAVLGLQIKNHGYIPSPLPDAHCFAPAPENPLSYLLPADAIPEPIRPFFINDRQDEPPSTASERLTSLSQPSESAMSNFVQAFSPRAAPLPSAQAPRESDAPQDTAAAPDAPSFKASAAQKTAAAKDGIGNLFTSIRATYNSVAETLSEIDLTPLGKQAAFVRDTLGVGFKGLGKSAGDLSQQLAQSVSVASPGTSSTAQERSEEVYSGAVDGLSGADLNAVVEEFEHEADVLKKAFQRALHRALGSVALLGGTAPLQYDTPAHNGHHIKASHSSTATPQRRVVQPLLGGVPVFPSMQYPQDQPLTTLELPLAREDDTFTASAASFSHLQSGPQHLQPLWEQKEVGLRLLELTLRSVSPPVSQISLDLPRLDLPRMLVDANMMMYGAASSNAVQAANSVNATLGNALQQLRCTVETLRATVNDVCQCANSERVDLNHLYKAVANLDSVMGGAKLSATSAELAPLAAQLDSAAVATLHVSGVEAEQLGHRLQKAAASLRDSSNFSVTATLQNAQRIVSKIPETAANEEDIAPLLEEFEQLTAQLQAELDQLSAVTNNVSPSKL